MNLREVLSNCQRHSRTISTADVGHYFLSVVPVDNWTNDTSYTGTLVEVKHAMTRSHISVEISEQTRDTGGSAEICRPEFLTGWVRVDEIFEIMSAAQMDWHAIAEAFRDLKNSWNLYGIYGVGFGKRQPGAEIAGRN